MHRARTYAERSQSRFTSRRSGPNCRSKKPATYPRLTPSGGSSSIALLDGAQLNASTTFLDAQLDQDPASLPREP